MKSPADYNHEKIEAFLVNVAEELPIIRPISEFIHLNLLLPYQHLPFWEALKIVSAKFEAMPFADLDFFREKIERGEIPKATVLKKLNKRLNRNSSEVLENFLQSRFEFHHHDQRSGKLHHLWNKVSGVNIIQLSDGMLIKWLSMYLDQGIGLWTMPGADNETFYRAIRDLIHESYLKPAPFRNVNFNSIFPEDPEEAILSHLDFLCPDQKYQAEYIRESIFSLRGWAGIIYCLERNEQLLPFKRRITLIDFLALKLTLERSWILEQSPAAKAPDFSKTLNTHPNPLLQEDNFEIFRTLQEVLEEETYKKDLISIRINARTVESAPLYQAVFCMDDREGPLRRHIEELIPYSETFGTAGHYGIECLYQHDEDPFPKKQCPAPVPAKYLIREKKIHSSAQEWDSMSHDLIQPTHTIFQEGLHSFFGGLKSSAILFKNLFFPLAFKNLENVREINPDTELHYKRAESDHLVDELKPGYTLEEMTELVYQQLMLIGFVHYFAPLIFIIGHGSSSSNNSYFATYGCGACSGRPGSANARTFVKMANSPEVRERIFKKFNLKISDTTTFVAGFHDTCRDVVEFYDLNDLPPTQRESFDNFKTGLSIALYKNAEERAQSFKLVSYQPVKKEAQKEVLRRSYSLFETRPELGHTNVVYAIVGKRNLTKGINLKRRSFLQSYDSSVDPTGEILSASLSAVIPVCSGISLDYFFSRVDNLKFGAGSKLPQNVVGNIGVSHGTESDLLFGLPYQMIDQHTPIRLFVLVEQTPEIALLAIQKNQLVRDIVFNNWVHYACWDSENNSYYIFQNGKMKKLDYDLEGLC